MKNKEISKILYEIADFLEIKGVKYKPRAYRKAARNIEALTEDVENIYERRELKEIEGVGESIAEKISKYLETGELEYYERLRKDVPVDIENLTNVEGLGPKSVKKLYNSLGIETLEDLEEAAKAGRIADVKGFGEKIQEKILENIDAARMGRERKLIGRIFPLVQDLKKRIQGKDVFERVNIVGSYRRRNPTIGDIDVLALSDDSEEAMEEFCNLNDVEEVLAKGDTKSSIIISGNIQVDLRIVDEVSYGSALMYFTGSKDHNVSIRSKAKGRDWKLNEYGLFDSNDERLAGEKEEEVYDKLDMSFIPPELRENTGEIESAERGSLPDLVERVDIRGDLQIHSNYSDGSASMREMVENAEEIDLDYVLFSDHGPSLKIAGGLSEKEFDEQSGEVEELNDEFDVEILLGVEANIVEDGLDISKDWCEKCDFLSVAMHNRPKDATDRILSVFENYPVDIWVHPLGRQFFSRDPLDIDLDKIVDKTEEEHIAIEISSQPERLDLDWRNVKKYRDKADYVISTDAHSTTELDFMRFGVSQARKGWCNEDSVLNTKSIDKARSYLNG
ncbi:hypothetical protein AKJ56_01615 [candidate division MSBL1 archaeon SCGC-AAA382N08]|uniref:DNA polymerase beta n=1 Tax=candidate division MSBL1 archaeon SCGC-AAA382N08 TaxID=1698285 RepID=A0A133VP99_9EURY|nr:hypothetical protein AKJ56_01615 [candidate division MSBL1 archaeon SCGC-AAA382N08]